MWPLYLTREIHVQKRLSTSKNRVLSFIQDPENILRTNPILTSVIPDDINNSDVNASPAKEGRWYTIVEIVPTLGGREMSTKFRCRWTKVEDGVDMEVHAGLGTRLTTRLRVEESGEEGKVDYSDVVKVQGLFLMMPFIVSRATRSHTMLGELVAEKVVNKD
ncbi:hypothetical protein BDN70DRAFT_876333 [Pholiota conissans]|uniref:DUF7053 domain-containing protein n=1 Tax=Pholiota conissans TaxID=109636 RepID=A0A9P6D2F4_9AGAR|nr:hypothetical protein BDN70DRAFT_876333 [Pholiota conissans]